MLSFTDQTVVGNVVISDVICDDIRLQNYITAVLSFSDDVGLSGMLLQHIKQYSAKGPSIINKQLPGNISTDVRINSNDRVFSSRNRLFHIPTPENPGGLVEVRRGMYTVSEMMKYKPVLSAVVSVTFEDVLIEPSKLYLSGINVVSYKNITVVMESEMVVRKYELT
jgi:hypothetical protein